MRCSHILNVALVMICAVGAVAQAAPAKGSSGYHVKQTWKVGGEGGWDYLTVDPQARRLYISRGSHVMVLDADSGKSVGDIPETDGVHGIALVPGQHKGYISAGRKSCSPDADAKPGCIVVIDTASLKTTATIAAPEGPDAIIFDPSSKRVFAFNGRSHDATAIDVGIDKVTKVIPLDGKPEFAASDGKGKVYVNIEDKSEIQVIDAKSLTVVSKWDLTPCDSPSGLAIDTANKRLFSGCENKMMVISDYEKGRVVTNVAIGAGVDAGRFDSTSKLAFTSNGQDGTLTVVKQKSADEYEVIDNVPTKRSARTMELDTKTHDVYVVAADFGEAPPAQPGQRPQRPPMVPGSFVVLVIGK